MKGNALFCAVLVAGMVCSATADLDLGKNIDKVKLVGMGSLEAGQIVKGKNIYSRDWEVLGGTGTDINHVWYQRVYMDLGVDVMVSDRARVTMVGEAKVTGSWRYQQEFYDDLQQKFFFYPHHMEGSYSFGNIEKPFLRLGAGVFPYQYNADVRNLGEYLYRTGTYPQYMMNEFDFPMARLTGFNARSQLLDSLNLDLLFTTETQLPPFYDWGVSLLADYTLLKAITVGGGVFFSHLLSVEEQLTTPKHSENKYTDTIPGTVPTIDSGYYSFRGTKVMGRFAFDPKPFLGGTSFFGKNDLRLYAEVAILGLKNYPVHYDSIFKRIPVMVGFNLPTFKLLDVFAVEGEYFGTQNPNSYQEVFYRRSLPIPDIKRLDADDWDGYSQNHFKWSIYISKRLANFFTLTAEVAKDHTRLLRHDQKNQDFEESLVKNGHWAWYVKSKFEF